MMKDTQMMQILNNTLGSHLKKYASELKADHKFINWIWPFYLATTIL